MSLAESITARTACHAPPIVVGKVEVSTQCSFPLVDKSVGCSFRAGSESRSVQTTETVDQSHSTTAHVLRHPAVVSPPLWKVRFPFSNVLPQRFWKKGLTNAMSLAESITARTACHAPPIVVGKVEVSTQCSFPLADKSVGCSFRAGSESRSVQTTETVDQSHSTTAHVLRHPAVVSPPLWKVQFPFSNVLPQRFWKKGLTNAMSLAESITARTACHAPLIVVGQVEVGTQCSSPVADKSVGCSFRAGSESRSVQTTETVDQSHSTTGLTNAMSLVENIAARTACHAPSIVVGQVEVGTQCSSPVADKSVGCSFRAGSESRSVQTTETVDQSCSTAASRPSISPSTANSDNSQQGRLQQDHFCDYEARKLISLEAHARVCTGKRLFKCDLCHKSFSKRDHLKSHLRTHTGDKPWQCPSCPQRFSHKSSMKDHLRTHTGEKPFQCPSCPQSFSHKSSMKNHLRTHTGEKPWQCASCLQSFSHRSSMKAHLRTHTGEKPFQCPSCLQSFAVKTNLKVHLRTHTGEKPFQCPSCLHSFSRKTDLKTHLRTHTGEKPFQCPSCPRSFAVKSHMKVHLRTHTGEKPFQCPSCPQSFSHKSSLKDHLRTHTGEKPFQCPSCPQSFSHKSSMKNHLRTHIG
ncbi:oocyte zinc finger protein XlCOF22-like isoform X7 [Dermacentor albipictus]|uniref:oocyte zinc finger protein XlCOF22-like isoform X7 n=1 Tax=Dermacentor albipictus TaxID=60249 RepID=UPI0038FCEB97